jgi:hypothetical protein
MVSFVWVLCCDDKTALALLLEFSPGHPFLCENHGKKRTVEGYHASESEDRQPGEAVSQAVPTLPPFISPHLDPSQPVAGASHAGHAVANHDMP